MKFGRFIEQFAGVLLVDAEPRFVQREFAIILFKRLGGSRARSNPAAIAVFGQFSHLGFIPLVAKLLCSHSKSERLLICT